MHRRYTLFYLWSPGTPQHIIPKTLGYLLPTCHLIGSNILSDDSVHSTTIFLSVPDLSSLGGPFIVLFLLSQNTSQSVLSPLSLSLSLQECLGCLPGPHVSLLTAASWKEVRTLMSPCRPPSTPASLP
uniref:Uncharacterized protein n=1 Tax=Myotis myotis TaxID=51298 RepID=A0A7J7SR79_MYOMY|nr:hypothetical protein mMyoMyo1_009346 [Myotis myotis]